jgi:hypothetical protein
MFQASLGKISETPITTEKSWAWWHVPIISVTVGGIKWEEHGLGWPGQKSRPHLQNNQSKKGWR